MKKYLYISIYFLFTGLCFGQIIPIDSLYLGQTPPGTTPIIFQLPFSSGLRATERISITSDGKEIYYGELNGYPPTIARIKCFKYLDNKWQGPFIVFEGYVAPALSVNDSIIYMQKDINGVACMFLSYRNGTGWTIPSRLFSTNLQTHYSQETNSKNFYLASILSSPPGTGDICKVIVNNSDTTIQSLGIPVNTPANENDFFIARDESYIIHTRYNTGSSSDLYINYKKTDGSWTNSKTLGIQINTPEPNWEYGPFVTNDNKYLFFTRGGYNLTSYYTYWSKVDELIDSLKYTNFIPYVKLTIPNQTDTLGRYFSFSFSDSTFIDDDGNNTLTYSATLSNRNPLPAWLLFNPTTRTFSGTPTATGTFTVKVTATDTANASASTTFNFVVITPVSVDEEKNQHPEDFGLQQNFPNPFNPSTSISFSLPSKSFVSLKVFDLMGRDVATIVFEELSAGTYTRQWNAAGIPSGIYFYRLQSGNTFETKKLVLLK